MRVRDGRVMNVVGKHACCDEESTMRSSSIPEGDTVIEGSECYEVGA